MAKVTQKRSNTVRTVDSIDFQLLFESTPGLYLVLLPDLTIAAVSDLYLAATMTKRNAILGKGLFEVFPDNPSDPGADGVSNLRSSLDQVLHKRTAHCMSIQKYDIRRPDGSFEERFWAPMNKPVVRENGDIVYIVHTVVDVTAQELERKQGEATNRKTQLLLQTCIESLKEYLVFSVDRQYRILNFNTAFKEATALAYGASIEVEMNLLDCITGDVDKERARRNFDLALSGQKHVTIEEYGSEERNYFETSYNPMINDQGGIIGVSVLTINVTERKRAEVHIHTMNRQLEEARETAELANRTKSQFLANMSHEIRTPLNAVIGLSHLLLKTELTPKQVDYLKKIELSSDSLLRIINDILDFSKVESGILTLEETNFDLEEIFQKLGNVITYKANAKGLEVAFGIDSLVPTYLMGDPVRLEQILTILCSNAVKFTDHGEIIVSVRMAEDAGDNINLSFEVRDTGIGMDGAQIGKLFQPFIQADDTISRKYGGTGLGLSIIKRLAELMNGSVGVESEPGKGSCFHFNVWLRKQKHQRKMPVPSVDLREMGVLLVDDNPSAKEILKQALTSLSLNVTAVSSGIQAIHFLKNNFHHSPVKLILMDWKMPGMDGLEAARIIREDAQLRDVRIMMMCTSYANEELYQAIEPVELSGILIKPIRYSELYDSIIRALESGFVSAEPKWKAPGAPQADDRQ